MGVQCQNGSQHAAHPTCAGLLLHPSVFPAHSLIDDLKPAATMKKKFDKAKQSASRLMVKFKPRSRSRSHSPNAPDPDPGSVASGPSTGRHEYADPQAPQTALGTTGSVVQEFLTAARDGSDLCLPLKAALVGAVKILEICQVTIN